MKSPAVKGAPFLILVIPIAITLLSVNRMGDTRFPGLPSTLRGLRVPDKLAPAPALATPGGSHVPAAHAVVGGEVKGAERLLPRPDYPTALRAQGLSGKVAVAVAVNRKGAVVAARALGGPAPLQQAAEVAARKARFAPQRAARRSGTIVYDFTP